MNLEILEAVLTRSSRICAEAVAPAVTYAVPLRRAVPDKTVLAFTCSSDTEEKPKAPAGLVSCGTH